ESITLQGRDAILYAEKMLNQYAKEFWHKDKKLHEKMGIDVKNQVQNPVVIYIDTDSCYVTFQELLDNSNWKGDEKSFIQALYKYRLKDYLEKIHQIYANNLNGDNFLSFEMESIAKSGIWMAKKKYIQDIVWEDPDVSHDSLSKIKVKGFDTIQSSTPPFARKHLTEIIKVFFSQETPNLKEVVTYLKEIKKEFKLSDIEDITFSLKCNGYNKYIIDDQKNLEYASGCQYHVRGSAYHNLILSKSKFKNKYQRVGDGNKVKVYYTTDKTCDSFAFAQGSYPYEFAPEIDYEMQFEKCMLDPLNRLIKVIGLKQLDRNLLYTSAIF
ncbi:MAG: DNA polymerase domain-containing protein, partial [Atribacterota bacterium]